MILMNSGADYVIDVIDVEKQEVYQMSINELNTYFKAQPRVKVYNLISFEISKTELTKNITAPRIVVELSWASNGIWPIADEEPNPNTANTKPELSLVTETPKSIKNYIAKPEVHKYCLISAANSYTDFHVDFGGSSVWYHTVKVNLSINDFTLTYSK
jgi:lysine-specific demethylase PHF8